MRASHICPKPRPYPPLGHGLCLLHVEPDNSVRYGLMTVTCFFDFPALAIAALRTVVKNALRSPTPLPDHWRPVDDFPNGGEDVLLALTSCAGTHSRGDEPHSF